MIIVTGGAGFIGSCLLWRLNEEGITDILVVDRLGETGKWKNLRGKVFSDYMEKDKFIRLIGDDALDYKADAVFHLGACSSTTELDASYLMENNYRFSRTLAEWSLRKKIPFYYASSAATYGDGVLGYSDRDENTYRLTPLNMYGYSKHLFDLWVLRNKLSDRVVGLKYFNVFGPNEYHKGEMRSLVVKAYEQIQKDKKIRLFKSYKSEYADGEQMRDFVYVKDVLDIMIELYRKPKIRGIFNIGAGRARTWNDLAAALFNALELKTNIQYIEMPDVLKDKYQYFTEANLDKLREAGVEHSFRELESGVADYAGYLKNGSYI